MSADVVERYLRLGLRLDRHVEGTVDAYFGPPELAEEVKAAPPVDPAALAAEAESLLGEIEDGWLRDQVAGLATFARVVAGETLAYADEVERCYGIRPERTDESAFADSPTNRRSPTPMLASRSSCRARDRSWIATRRGSTRRPSRASSSSGSRRR